MTNHNRRYSKRVGLAAIGVQMRRWKIWQTVEEHVHIKQEVIRTRPLDRVPDAFINILAGGKERARGVGLAGRRRAVVLVAGVPVIVLL
jgi:hypothetical protein